MAKRTDGLRGVRVTWDNGNTTTTSVNGSLSDAEISDYYVGQIFNIGDPYDPCKDLLVTGVKVEILD